MLPPRHAFGMFRIGRRARDDPAQRRQRRFERPRIRVGRPVGVAVDDADVYWTEGQIYLQRVPKAGGATFNFALANKPRYIALDATHYYYSDIGVNTVGWSPKVGTGPGGTVTAWAMPGKLALDNDHVYWTSTGGGTWKAAKIGASATAIFSFWAGQGTGIAVDAIGLYVGMQDGTLWKVAK